MIRISHPHLRHKPLKEYDVSFSKYIYMFDLYFSFVSFEPKDATSTSASYRLHNYVYCINLNTLEVLPPNKHCL